MRGEGETEEEADEEAEAVPDVADEVASEPEMMDKDVPGLGDTGDLMLIEKWHARFSGLKLQSAGVEGQLICNRSNLNCLFKLEARTLQKPCWRVALCRIVRVHVQN